MWYMFRGQVTIGFKPMGSTDGSNEFDYSVRY
jgi:hypothetical protein